MFRAVIESPYAGDVETHVLYARRCLKDSLSRGEAPFASHLLYTQDGVLNDADDNDRRLGIHAGHQWLDGAQKVAVYIDYGISYGMQHGIEEASGRPGVRIEFRTIGRNPS